MKMSRLLAVVAAVASLAIGSAHASLTTTAVYSGELGVSSDGWASSSLSTGTLTANIPTGATIRAAYLYTSTFNIGPSGVTSLGGSFNGNAVSYTSLGQNGTACCSLTAGRMDVTSIVATAYAANSSLGTYNFSIVESNTSRQDGEALIVVYEKAGLATSTVAILDGFASAAGDVTTLNLAAPVAAGFAAEMRLGIGFSFNGNGCSQSSQTSRVTVNGTVITNNAGCNDDSVDGAPGNGNLFTMGDDNDAFSSLLPTTAADHERYDLLSLIHI